MRVMRRPAKSRFTVKVRLPENHMSTGYVTIAVFASCQAIDSVTFGEIARALLAGLAAEVAGANSTLSTIGDGISPSCRTVTRVCRPLATTLWIAPSTDSVVNSQ